MRSFVIPPRIYYSTYHVWDSDVGGTLCGYRQMTGWKVVVDIEGMRECINCRNSNIRCIAKENNDTAT